MTSTRMTAAIARSPLVRPRQSNASPGIVSALGDARSRLRRCALAAVRRGAAAHCAVPGARKSRPPNPLLRDRFAGHAPDERCRNRSARINLRHDPAGPDILRLAEEDPTIERVALHRCIVTA